MISEYLFALPFGCVVPMFLLWSPVGTVGGLLTTSGKSLSDIPGLLTGSNVVDLILAAVIGVILLFAPWLTAVRVARVGPLHFGATRLGLLLGSGLLGSAAGGVVLTTSIGGAVLCFGTASCLYAVYENERFAVLGAERVVADLVAYRDVTAVDVERFCGPKGVLGLDGLGQRRGGGQADTFCLVVAEQLRAHAGRGPQPDAQLSVGPGDLPLDEEGERRVTPIAKLVAQDAVETAISDDTRPVASKGMDATGGKDNANEDNLKLHSSRKGSHGVRTVLSAQIATDLTELVRTTFADTSEVSALFPSAKRG